MHDGAIVLRVLEQSTYTEVSTPAVAEITGEWFHIPPTEPSIYLAIRFKQIIVKMARV